MTTNKVLILFAFVLGSFGITQAANPLFVCDHLFDKQKITDIAMWQGSLWVSTDIGLFKITKNGGYSSISIPALGNDLITCIDNSTPFNLVCGTYNGRLLLINQSENDYCGQVWDIDKKLLPADIYVNTICRNTSGLWLGSLEMGAYLLSADENLVKNFTLSYDEKKGLNVNKIVEGTNGEIWALAQDHVFYITRIFGIGKYDLQYVESRKAGNHIKMLRKSAGQIYMVEKRRRHTNILNVRYNRNTFDYRVDSKIELPEYFKDHAVKAIKLADDQTFWVLGDKLYHLIDDEKVETYEVPDEVEIQYVNGLEVVNDKVWISTPSNGLFCLSKEQKPSEELITSGELSVNLGKVVELEHVYFEPGDSLLSWQSFAELKNLVDIMVAKPNLTIVLSGHTALDGDPAALYELSLARARAVGQYLSSQGINRKRIKIFGFGATQPKDPDHLKSAVNRRVEIVLSK